MTTRFVSLFAPTVSVRGRGQHPDRQQFENRLSPESTALHLAIGLFVSEEATLGQAAEVAGLPQAEFLLGVGKRRIPIHYGLEELSEDLRTVDSLATQ